MINAARCIAPAFVIAAVAGTVFGAPILYNSQDRSIVSEAELFMGGADIDSEMAPDNSPFITSAAAQVVESGSMAMAISTQSSVLRDTSIIASGSATGIVDGDGSAIANSQFTVSFDITEASLYSVSVSIANSTYLITGPSLNASTGDGSFTDQLVLDPGTYRVSFNSPTNGARNSPGASSWSFSLIEVPTPGTTALLGVAGWFLARRRR